MNVEVLVPVNPMAEVGGDFSVDGILHCGVCKEPKEYIVQISGIKKTVPCLCKCMTEEFKKTEEERGIRESLERLSRLRSKCIHDKSYRSWNFEADDGRTSGLQMEKVRRYVKLWNSMYEENCGLLLWGDNGTGKTFAAACIANALIDRFVPVLMTNFSAIVSDMGFNDNRGYLEELKNYHLLVIDDLGAERQNEYMLEKVFQIVDSRYRSNKPVIFTTNISLAEIKSPEQMVYKRIYDRILEMCAPMKFDGKSRRIEAHEDKKNMMRKLFSDTEE